MSRLFQPLASGPFKEWPDPAPGCERHCGIVVTGRQGGDYCGGIYVYGIPRLFLMPQELFKFDRRLGRELGMSKSRMLKMEEHFVFGDAVDFDANANHIVTLIVGRRPPILPPVLLDGQLCLKATVVRSEDGRIWCPEFGFVPDIREDRNINPLHDVTIEGNIRCTYDKEHPFDIAFGLHSYGPIDQHQMALTLDTPWRAEMRVDNRLPLPFLYDPDVDDPQEQEFDIVPQLRELYAEGGHNRSEPMLQETGVLLRDHIVNSKYPTMEFLRIWAHDRRNDKFKNLRLRGPQYLVPGTLVTFNAFYSEIHGKWLAYEWDRNRNKGPDGPVSTVRIEFPYVNHDEELNPDDEEMFLCDMARMPDLPGYFINDHLGLVSDRRGVLCSLTETLHECEQRAYAVLRSFTPGRITNFELRHGLKDFLEVNAYLRERDDLHGFIIGHEIICPALPNIEFRVESYITDHPFPPGTAVSFDCHLLENCERLTYTVFYLQRIGAVGRCNVDVITIDGKEAIICSVYLTKIKMVMREIYCWYSPLFGPVDDVNSLLKGRKGGARVVICRDRKFERATSVFYIHSLLDESAVESRKETLKPLNQLSEWK
ncbi:hypothetical protein QR680_018882 [Steinernema hermaphroditum]|uniref:Uncharacterized protein n=1 Tax=Steinernema hermaphroditum TaxID=289476 RepID=A0AA39LRI1_9BILA|nr:hypothetical protein QR680_018882 [Steinernema hermaphroditum]